MLKQPENTKVSSCKTKEPFKKHQHYKK